MARRDDQPRLHRGARPRPRRDPRVRAAPAGHVAGGGRRRRPGCARPTARRILQTLEELGYVRTADGGFELTPRVLELGMTYVLSPQPVGGRPAAHGSAGRAHPRVLVHRPAGRPGHRLRGPGRGAEDHRAGGDDRHPVPGHADLAGQGAAGRAAAGPRPSGCWPSPAGPGITPRWQPDAAERAPALREVRARGWALTDEQLARRHPLGGRAAARRRRAGDRGDQRDRARGRDAAGHPDRRVPAAAAADGRRRSARTGPATRPRQITAAQTGISGHCISGTAPQAAALP